MPGIAAALAAYLLFSRSPVGPQTPSSLLTAFSLDWRKFSTHLHHDYTGLEFSFSHAFKKLVNFFLNLLTNLLQSTFLAYRARDILDFNELGLHCRSAQISPRAALSALPWHKFNATSS